MMFIVIALRLALVLGVEDNALYGEYHFYKNFGIVFYDYSGREYHAINGESIDDSTAATFPTDRGAYFSGSNVIQLHNSLWPGPHFGNSWRFTVWLCRLNGDGLISRRNYDTGDEVILCYFMSDTMGCDVSTDSQSETLFSSSAFYVKC